MFGLHRSIGNEHSTLLLTIFVAACVCMATPSMFAADTEKVLASFSGQDGANPQAGVIFDASGNLYGTTNAGGDPSCKAIAGCGTIFRMSPGANGTWTKTTLHHFNSIDGANPSGALVFDSAGKNLYGTTAWGGSSSCVQGAFKGCGTVFQLSHGTNGAWTLKTIHRFSFSGPDGSNPASTLVFDSAGNLYGTTNAGGGNNAGTLFELSPAVNGTWAVKTLHTFTGANGDGANPFGPLVFDATGNLFGTTTRGGTHNAGTVFELSPATGGNWTATTLYSFSNSSGNAPDAGVIFDSIGNLYGTTSSDGDICGCKFGTVFELVAGAGGTWTEKTLHTFTTDGSGPGGVIFDSAGNLYGVTFVGASSGDGTVFELSPGSGGTWTATQLHVFGGTDGAGPVGSLVFDSSGNLYGASGYGGANNNKGTVFEVSPGAGSR
jgi:uncharacterized repeat protein (TIGR03803 family)